MLSIIVYGPGCSRCAETEKVVRRALTQMGVAATVQEVDDPEDIAKAGILFTPAVTVNGLVKVSGRIPEEHEIKQWLAAQVVTTTT
jgi:small redox-active disulfide protein 2